MPNAVRCAPTASGVAPLCWSSRLMGLVQLHLILRTDMKSVE